VTGDRQPWDDAIDAAASLFGWTPEQVEAERIRQADRWTLLGLDDEMDVGSGRPCCVSRKRFS
jgi:hypothetical protein